MLISIVGCAEIPALPDPNLIRYPPVRAREYLS